MVKRTESRALRCMSFLLVLFFLGCAHGHAGEAPAKSRFFLSGDGRFHIKNVKSGKEANVSLLNPDGSLNEMGSARIDEVFELTPRDGSHHISLRLLLMLDHFSDRVAPGRAINLTSGYRSPEYNSRLRNAGGNVASTSLHMDGMALDFNIDGVNGKELWRIIKDADCCGVGHYGGANVHLDSARPRFWEAATSKVRTKESEHNRRIYLTTDFDRYRAGDAMRLSLVSISDFGFGVGRVAYMVRDKEGEDVVGPVRLSAPGDDPCIVVHERDAACSILSSLPDKAARGRYRIRVDFCRRPFGDMPERVVSNEVEITDVPQW
ncbi:MAG: DUF882 domain-containing protein [Syntrophobacteraceae bacterium]|nr:DUF882 domain-containing protein [Syntrophobacteraceae bacterium]